MSSRFLSIRPEKTPRIVAFASGKGGVGKTVCTANLSVHLAERYKVLTVDMDLGCGNLNASLGVRSISRSINDFLGGRVATLTPVKSRTAVDNLQLISCSYNPVANTVLTAAQKEHLVEHLRSDDADYILMDLGAGVSDDILDLFAAADMPILITGPESLALHNAFVFVKSLVYRILARNLEKTRLSRKSREGIVRQLYESGDQEMGQTIERVRQRDRSTAELIQKVLSGIRLNVILNKLRDPSEEVFVNKLQQLVRKNLQVELNYLGCIPYDDNVKKSLNSLVPFAMEYKASPANEALRTVSSRLLDSFSDASSLVRELQETKEVYEREKQEWLKENMELKRKVLDLSLQFESWQQRQVGSEKKLEESLVRRDEFIESLERQIREREETIRRLREQLQIVREAQITFFAAAIKQENMRPT